MPDLAAHLPREVKSARHVRRIAPYQEHVRPSEGAPFTQSPTIATLRPEGNT